MARDWYSDRIVDMVEIRDLVTCILRKKDALAGGFLQIDRTIAGQYATNSG